MGSGLALTHPSGFTQQPKSPLLRCTPHFPQKPKAALSPSQIAQLTSDIVWLVEKEVKLPDGTTQKVLAPQVYLLPRTGDLKADGTLIAGQSVFINASGDVNNSGTVAGRNLLQISANNIANVGGTLSADQVSLTATQDIVNRGGRISAVDSLALSAGQDITVETTTATGSGQAGNGNFSQTRVDRIAGLYVTGSTGALSAVAGRNLTLTAAEVVNTGSGATQLAALGDVVIGTVTTRDVIDIGGNSRNHARVTASSEVGSRIRTQGDLNLIAGNDIAGRAVDIQSQGSVTLAAGNDVTLAAGRNEQSVDLASYSTGRTGGGLMGGKKVTRSLEIKAETSTALEGNISGQNVTIQSGRDIALEGGRFVAQETLALDAERDITLAAAYDTLQASQSGSYKGGTKVKQWSEQVSSNTATGAILVAGSDLSLQSGGNTTVVGSALAAGNEISVKTGGDLALLSAESDRQVQSFDYNQGKRKAVTHTREETETRQLLSTITAGGGVAIDVQGNFTAEVAEKNADGSFKADRMTATGIEKGDSRQQVSITGSGSGGSSLAETAKKALAEGVRANANDAFTAGEQKTGQAAIESFLNSGLVQVGSNPKLDSQLKQILGDGKGLTSTEASGQITLTVAGEAKVQEVYNALKLTENFDVKKFPDAQTAQLVTLVVAVALTVCTAGAGAASLGAVAAAQIGGGAFAASVINAAAIGMASTMIGQMAGGASFDQAFKAGVKAAATSAVTAGVTYGIGELVGAAPTNQVNGSTVQAGTNAASTTSRALEAMATPQYWAQTGLNALAKGAITQAQGGKFEDGALGSVIGSLSASGAGIIGDFTNQQPLSNLLAHAALGCAVAAAGKQDCASGAIGGAASSVLNRVLDATVPGSQVDNPLRDGLIAGATTGASALLVGALGGDAMTAGNAAANESINNALSHKQATRLTESIQACAGEAQCINDKVYNAILLSNRQGSSIDQSNAQSAVSVLAQLANDPTIPLSDANRAAIATLAGKNVLDYVDWSKTPNLSGQSNASPNSPFSPNWNTGDFSAGLSQGSNSTSLTAQFGGSGQTGDSFTGTSSPVNPPYKAASSAVGMLADGLGVITGGAITVTGIGLIATPEPTTLSKWAGAPLTIYGAAYTSKSIAGFTLNAGNFWTAINGSTSDSDYLPGSALELAVRAGGGSPELERAAVAVDMGWGLATGRVLDARLATGVITNPRVAALLQPSTYTMPDRQATILAPNLWNVTKGVEPRAGLIDLTFKSYENVVIPLDSSLNNK